VRLDIDAADRRAEFRLERPDRPPTEAFVDAVGPDEFAVNVRNLTERGDYRLTAERSHDDEAASATPRATGARPSGERLWEVEFAVNGPASESELTYLDEAGVRERLGNVPMRWIAPGEPIHLEGALVRGQDLWQWLLAVALACLLVELIVLAAGQAVADRRAAAVTAPGGVAAASGVPAFGGTNSERGGR
jgi:hypothetical protein